MDPSAALQEQNFKVYSKSVQCQLTDKEAIDGEKPVSDSLITLEGYCHFKDMLSFRLDTDAALVLVSSISFPDGDGEPIAVVEHIRKVGPDLEAMKASCAAEFQAMSGVQNEILGMDFTISNMEGPPVKKLKTLKDEPQTPVRRSDQD